MTRTIQKPATTTRRRAFLEHAGTLYGISPTAAALDQVDALDDLALVTLAFPALSDAERQEALWALGTFIGH